MFCHIISLWELHALILGNPKGLIGNIYIGGHKILLHTKYISCGPHGFREYFFLNSHYKSYESFMLPWQPEFKSHKPKYHMHLFPLTDDALQQNLITIVKLTLEIYFFVNVNGSGELKSTKFTSNCYNTFVVLNPSSTIKIMQQTTYSNFAATFGNLNKAAGRGFT